MTRKSDLFRAWLLLRGTDAENTLEDAFVGGYGMALNDVRSALSFMGVDAHPLYLMRDYKRANRRNRT